MSYNLQDRLLFRYWNENNEEMSYINDLYWFEENRIHNIEDLQENDYLMQSTGIYDKKHKLIYEYDIIHIVTHNTNARFRDFYYIVIWHKKQWFLAHYTPKCHLCKSNNEKCKICFNWYICSTYQSLKNFEEGEVVGNIFENKNLLKKTNRDYKFL